MGSKPIDLQSIDQQVVQESADLSRGPGEGGPAGDPVLDGLRRDNVCEAVASGIAVGQWAIRRVLLGRFGFVEER